jgi:hypothetical protein
MLFRPLAPSTVKPTALPWVLSSHGSAVGFTGYETASKIQERKTMAQAILLTLEKELLDASAIYAKSATGKALARESDRLDTAARACHVTPLTAMLSESQAALIEQLRAEGFDPSKMRLAPEQWFSSAEGLKTVTALIGHVTANLNHFKQPNPILRDLRAVEALLQAAEAADTRFHFTKASA